MKLASSASFTQAPGPCWHCTGFIAIVYQGTAARCSRPDCVPIRSSPHVGCASFVREPGADDVPEWVPEGVTPPTGWREGLEHAWTTKHLRPDADVPHLATRGAAVTGGQRPMVFTPPPRPVSRTGTGVPA